MNQPSRYERVCNVVREATNDQEVFLAPATTLVELGFDSIDKVYLAYRLEKEFGIGRLSDDWPDATTLEQITDNISKMEESHARGQAPQDPVR